MLRFSVSFILLIITQSISFGANNNIHEFHSPDRKIFRLGYVDFPPYTYKDENGRAAGIYIDKAQNYFSELGLSFTPELLPAKRLYQYLAEGRVDFFMGITTAPAIQGHVNYGKEKIGSIELRAFYYSQNQGTTLNDFHDIQNMSIGIIRGYSYGNNLNKLGDSKLNNSFKLLETHEAGFGMLIRNRIDVFLDYENPSAPVLQKINDLNIRHFTIFDLNCHFVFSKKVPHAKQILADLDVLLQEDQ